MTQTASTAAREHRRSDARRLRRDAAKSLRRLPICGHKPWKHATVEQRLHMVEQVVDCVAAAYGLRPVQVSMKPLRLGLGYCGVHGDDAHVVVNQRLMEHARFRSFCRRLMISVALHEARHAVQLLASRDPVTAAERAWRDDFADPVPIFGPLRDYNRQPTERDARRFSRLVMRRAGIRGSVQIKLWETIGRFVSNREGLSRRVNPLQIPGW